MNAPVIIPTLCRYEHFRECLESLGKCRGADKTEVFIGLDYPAKDSHWAGYLKIKEYLNGLARNHPFKELHVYEHTRNQGVSPNINFLRAKVMRDYEAYIFSEDDNVFSPAFLSFVNQSLERFRNDSSVFAVCGYSHPYKLKFDDNNFYRQNVDFSAWGYGIWRDRMLKAQSRNRRGWWLPKLFNPLAWIRVARNGNNRLLEFLRRTLKGSAINDNVLSVYMAINGMDMVMPRMSMVRNMGWDGSGEHCMDNSDVIAAMHSTQPIYNGDSFEMNGTGLEHYKENRQAYVQQSYGRISFLTLIRKLACDFGSLIKRS